MKQAALTTLMLLSLGACDSSGSGGTGPLGQAAIITPEVRIAVVDGSRACADHLSSGQSLSSLTSRGFTASRNHFTRTIANPHTIGNSKIRVETRRSECTVKVSPVFPDEYKTILAAAEGALTSAGYRTEVIQINSVLGRKVFVRDTVQIEPRTRRSGASVQLILKRTN